jgi:hypothetical protein
VELDIAEVAEHERFPATSPRRDAGGATRPTCGAPRRRLRRFSTSAMLSSVVAALCGSSPGIAAGRAVVLARFSYRSVRRYTAPSVLKHCSRGQVGRGCVPASACIASTSARRSGRR